MRHVFPTDEIPHLWAHQTQSEARNPQGNLYFQDTTIFSYRASWPLAKIHNPGPRKVATAPLVLCNANQISSTTNRHQSAVNRACSHLVHMEVPRVDPLGASGHGDNLAHLAAVAAGALKTAQRAQKDWSYTSNEGIAQRAIEHAGAYLSFFGIKRTAPMFPAADWAAARTRLDKILNPDPKALDARERARAARKQAEYATARLAELAREYGPNTEYYATQAARTDWRLGNPWGVHVQYARRYNSAQDNPVMLRVDGAEIVTSQGARIPVEHAPRIWALVGACISSGRAYERNGHTEHAGNYAIDRIEPDGTLVSGCHTIPHAELCDIARQLNLI